MADDSELVGGISVSLGASDTKLIGDLAEAERLVQAWAKQVATVELRATFKGGTAAGGPGGGQDLTQLTRALEQAIANASARLPARPQQPAAPRVVAPGVAATGAAGAGSRLQQMVNEELAKTGEAYDELTGTIEKAADAHRAQRSAVEASTRSTRQNAEVETATIAKIDTSDLQAEIKGLVGALAELHAALNTAAESAPAVATPTGGKRRRGSSRARPDEEDDGGIGIQTRMAAFALSEEQRGAARVQQVRISSGQAAFRASERQRVQEVAATRRQFATLSSLADDYFTGEEERIGKQEVIGLTAKLEAQRAAPTPPPRAPVPPRTQQNETPEERARRERDARDQEFANQANAPRRRLRPAPETAAVRAAQQRQEQLFAATRTGIVSPEEREQRIQERIEQQRANVAAATSTGRTSASRIASVLGGTGGRRLEADIRAADARRELNAANRAALPFERELATLNEDIANATPRAAAGLRQSRDAFRADPKVVDAFKRQEEAIKGVAKATTEYEKLQSGGNIARNLTAIAAGSFAFSAALKAVDIGIQALGQAAGPTLERLSGFAATTAAYTDSLSDATRAASGNAQAVTALKLAGTGLAASTAQSIQPLIQQRAEVEAGNKALQEQIESLHVFENLRRSNQQAGITTTTGGLFGTPVNGIPGAAEQIANLFQQQGAVTKTAQTQSVGRFQRTIGGEPVYPGAAAKQQADILAAQKDFAASLELVNGQLEKGGDAAAKFRQAVDTTDSRIEQTAAAFDQLSPAMAAAIRDNHLYSDGIKDQAAALKSLQAINIAGTLPDPALLQQQFNRQRQANINAAERQQQFSLQTQIPAQQALSALANPLQPVGTGVAAANAKEQQQIVQGQQRSIELQDQLNAYYAQGKQILIDTYKVPESLINSVAAIGQEIASTQASIRNEQAAYQVAQYNFQLRIARRTLADIGGLTGKNFGAGQSYLGQLERENLALSRQSQLLQFNLSQRQINFQQALAGFQTPGVTPEEREARVKEAKIEAEFAQKQLDIAKQIFGNQVQIVDIQNLRQGADLAAQIALLLQGRKVTIDTAQAEERLLRLQAVQAKNVAQVSTYLTKVDNLVGLAFSEIQQLELAAGKAMASVAQQVLKAYGVVINGIIEQLNAATDSNAEIAAGGGADRHAAGAVGMTSGATTMTIGEAGGEAYAILRNPRTVAFGGTGGGVTIGSIFSGPVSVRSNEDIDDIVRKVQRSIGTQAALKGLRSVG
jgi:hypothetical protein